ncbi:unnamed protein product [Cochlearia groenlandica]
MSSSKSSVPTGSTSRPVAKRVDRSAVSNEQLCRSDDRLSPAAGSATDRASDLPSAGILGSSSGSKVKPPPIYPFPLEYEPFKDQFLKREEVPWTEEGLLPPPTADPPLPAGNPPADVAPPPPPTPEDAPSEVQHASTEVVPTTGVKRAREGVNEPSADLLRVTRPRTEEAPIESRTGSGEPVVVGDQAAGLGSEEAGRAAADVDPSEQGNEEGDGLVAYKRTLLNFSYESLLAEEKSSAQARFVAVEKERDAAIAKVKELESSLASVKKSGRSRKLKKQLDKAEADNAELKKRLAESEAERTVLRGKAEMAEFVKIALKEELGRMESEKGDLEKALEAEAEASRIRELALKSSREAEETGARELAELKADYDQLSEVGALEVKCFRERLVVAKQRFDALCVASEARLGKLKAYLEEQKIIEEYSSFYIQMKGVFDTLERLETKYAIKIPPIFERQCREREGKLERWLEERPQLSYEASDFELPAELELDSLADFMLEEPTEDADVVQSGGGRADGEVAEEETTEDEVAEGEEARDEEIRDEVAGDANLPEESEAVRQDE